MGNKVYLQAKMCKDKWGLFKREDRRGTGIAQGWN